VTAVDLKKKARAQANARLSALTRGLHNSVDGVVAATKPANTTCSRGCAGCCRQLVLCPRPEAIHIVHRYPDVVRAVLPVLVEQKRRFDEIAPNLPRDVWREPDLRTELGKRWWKQNAPCAFLTADKECSVYEARPMVCRMYFSLSDPKHCFSEEADANHIGWHPGLIPESPSSRELRKRPYIVGTLQESVLDAWEGRS
jgi:Fe-S-cluster containining protein